MKLQRSEEWEIEKKAENIRKPDFAAKKYKSMSKPIPPKIGLAHDRFIKIAVVCLVIVIAICFAGMSGRFDPPPAQNPYDTIAPGEEP